MNPLAKVVKKDFKLPSPPAIAIQILDAVKDDHATSASLSKIISSDPALAARILKFANSSLYASRAKIDTIDRAITVMGTETLKNIALSFAIAKTNTHPKSNGFDFDLFWKRSITSAVSSNVLTDSMGSRKDNSFVTALLKDIGMLFMYASQPQDYIDVFKTKLSNGSTLVEAERNIFGFDHQEIGAAILEHWSFPKQIYHPIRFHHQCSDAPVSIREDALLLELADKIASAYHGSNTVDRIKEIHRVFHRSQTITDEEVTALIDRVGEQSIEILSSFNIDAGSMKTYSELLQEANDKLGKLNLTYEQLILDLKQSKEKSDKLAKELKKANEQLRQLALRDGLTTLYNHTYFQDRLMTEISKARRYKRVFSLVILDIDHFKTVNDTYGHVVGDHVLRQVALEIKKRIRTADIASRYGGEEFTIILPETDTKGAVLMADRLRSDIEELCLSSDGGIDFGVTVSAGVASYDPGRDNTMTTVELIKHADRGLYHSKRQGRNQVSLYVEADDCCITPGKV